MRGKEPMSNEEKKAEGPKSTQYELPTGAVALLEEILPTPQWYKDDPKQAKTIVHAVGALDALPDTVKRPEVKKDEAKEDFENRADAWASPILMFEWTDKQKEAVKKCVGYYLKQGAFLVNVNTVALLRLLGLDDE
jgi:hypothetical protein